MGEAFLVRRGGSRQVIPVKIALISVMFPTGSTCSCAKGGKTYTSNTSTGVVAFSVPEAGAWTLTITDGTKTKSVNVTVAQGDAKLIKMAYNYVILSPEDGLASGYSGVGDVDTSNNKLTMSGTCYLSPAVDLTDYTTLTVTARITHRNEGVYWDDTFYVGVSPELTGAAVTQALTTTATEYTLDISALTGSYYLGVDGGGITSEYTFIVLS